MAVGLWPVVTGWEVGDGLWVVDGSLTAGGAEGTPKKKNDFFLKRYSFCVCKPIFFPDAKIFAQPFLVQSQGLGDWETGRKMVAVGGAREH